MDTVTGTMKGLGPSTVESSFLQSSVVVYSYVEIGEQILKKVRVYHGLTGPLTDATQRGAAVTLYTVSGFLCGIKMDTGKTFASDMGGNWGRYYGALGISLVLGLPLLPLLGLGIPFLIIAWKMARLISLKSAAEGIPNAIVV